MLIYYIYSCKMSIKDSISKSSMAHLDSHKSHKSLLYFLSVFLSISLIKSQQVSTDPSFYYNLCAPSRCNNLSLSYPFGLSTPCHPSNLQPLCPTNQSLLLTSSRSTDTFRVLSINFSDPITTTMLIASDSLFTCGAQVSRPNYVSDIGVFTVISTNLTSGTHLNCTAPIPSDSFQGLQNASCLGCNQNTTNVCYYVPWYVSYPGCQNFHMNTPGGSFNATSVTDLRGYLQSGYEIAYIKTVQCRGCEASGGRCGAQPSSGSFGCFCTSGVQPLNCTHGTIESPRVNGLGRDGPRLSRPVVAAISASVSILFLVFFVTLVVILVCRRKQNFHFKTISSISPTRYSYSQLKKFTNNFSSRLGEGGFGSVYKGTIHQNGVEVPVAVKMLKKTKQVEKQFMNEVATIGSIHHHNLVVMLGYCVDGNNHALIYEFMENGSLDKYIYDIKRGKDGVEDESNLDYKKLSPKQLYNIAMETARGILYLHQGCVNKILHFDIKPSNVLLDSNFSAKVADFGLARMIDKDHSHVSLTRAQGTPGYGAPEMWLRNFGPVTDKSDVYSYGMLLLEMVGRRKNYDPEAPDSSQVYFPEWLYNKIERDEFPLLLRSEEGLDSFEIVVDEENRNDEEDVKAIERMCFVGLWCIQHIPANRPSMDRVVQMLEGNVEIEIPIDPFPHTTTNNI